MTNESQKGKDAGVRQRFSWRPSTPSNTRSADLVCHESPLSAFSEALRNIRTSLLLSSPGSSAAASWPSPPPTRGKENLPAAMNLAIVLAQQGKKVLLVDADLRKPRLHKALQILATRSGLSNYLSGNTTPDELDSENRRSGHRHHHKRPDSAEPFRTHRIAPDSRNCCSTYRKKLGYEHVMFDSPQRCRLRTPSFLNSKIDGTSWWFEPGKPPENRCRRRKRLHQGHAHLFGCVLNGVRERLSYYKGYKYKYHENRYRMPTKLKQSC